MENRVYITKRYRTDTAENMNGEGPELPDISDNESANGAENIGLNIEEGTTNPRFGGNPGESMPGSIQQTEPISFQQQDPMLPLIYFIAGAGSALIAFLVFYLCLRFLPRRTRECEHNREERREEKLAIKEKEGTKKD